MTNSEGLYPILLLLLLLLSLEPLEDAEKMFPEGEEMDVPAEQGTISDIKFSVDDIKDAMGELDETSASGPDQFPSIIL